MFSIKKVNGQTALLAYYLLILTKIRSKSKYQSDDDTRKLVYEWRFSHKKMGFELTYPTTFGKKLQICQFLLRLP